MDMQHSKIFQYDLDRGWHKRIGWDNSYKCSKCGKIIRGIAYQYYDKYYCYDCYIKIFENLEV